MAGDFDFGDILGGLFGGAPQDPAKRAQESMKRASDRIKKNEQKPKPRMRVRRFGGEVYIPAADVAALLEANGITGTAKKLRALDKPPP